MKQCLALGALSARCIAVLIGVGSTPAATRATPPRCAPTTPTGTAHTHAPHMRMSHSRMRMSPGARTQARASHGRLSCAYLNEPHYYHSTLVYIIYLFCFSLLFFW